MEINRSMDESYPAMTGVGFDTHRNNNATVGSADKEMDGTAPKAGVSKESGCKESEQFQFERFAEFMEQRGLMLVDAKSVNAEKGNTMKSKDNNVKVSTEFDHMKNNHSVVTIYKAAVPPANSKQGSSSSELDTSDEIEHLNVTNVNLSPNNDIEKFITEVRENESVRRNEGNPQRIEYQHDVTA